MADIRKKYKDLKARYRLALEEIATLKQDVIRLTMSKVPPAMTGTEVPEQTVAKKATVKKAVARKSVQRRTT